jgi:hypothetical protein
MYHLLRHTRARFQQYIIYLSCPVLFCHVMSYPIMSCHVLSWPHPILSCPVPPCPVLSWPGLACSVASWRVLVIIGRSLIWHTHPIQWDYVHKIPSWHVNFESTLDYDLDLQMESALHFQRCCHVNILTVNHHCFSNLFKRQDFSCKTLLNFQRSCNVNISTLYHLKITAHAKMQFTLAGIL